MSRITEKIRQGRAALFLGAGVSVAAGAPSTPELVQKIKSTFSKVQFDTDDFVDVCQAVIDSDYYDGRTELETLIRQIMLALKPSKWHLELPKYPWAAIFTTNFDDLIEESFRMQSGSQKREYQCVLTDDFSMVDRRTLRIFKLMGTAHARRTDPGRMVLSRLDFMNALKMRLKCIEVLMDIIRDGTIVFIGYSGRDQLAFEVMGGVAEKYGRDSLAISYLILDDLSSLQGKTLKLSRHRMIPLQTNFEKFVEHLSKIPAKEIPQVMGEKQTIIGVSGFSLRFSPREIKQCSDFFSILDQRILEESPGDKDEFFRGTNQSWGAYREKWDFQREVYSSENGLRSRVLDEMKKVRPDENKVLIIRGIPGIGKSTILRRIAFDCYTEGAPVLIFDNSKSKFSFKTLDGFLMEIDRRLLKESESKITNAKSLVVFDDILSTSIDPTDVSSYLASRGRSSLIIVAMRMEDEREWFNVAQKNIITIPSKLSKDETHRLSQHLKNLDFLPSSDIWAKVILKELESSFFAAMYSLVDPSKRPLGRIIYEQFTELPEYHKKIFLCICAFHRFNLPINLELLCRVTSSNNYERLIEALSARKLREIVCINVDQKENTLYTTHNQIIAKKTFDFFLPDKIRQKELYDDILNKAHFSLEKERELIDKMLIRNMGPNRNVSGLPLQHQLELFTLICKRLPTKSLLHHLGILQSQARNFVEAEKTLKRARDFRRRYTDAYRGESTRNILTSLGCMYIDWAEEKVASDQGSPDELYDKAEAFLLDAMKYRYPMPHPYHALANMYIKIGDRREEEVERFEYYAKALEAIDAGKTNVHRQRALRLYETEIEIFSRLRNEKAIEKAISVLEKKYKSARGYYLYSKSLLLKSQKTGNPRVRRAELEKAYFKLNEGLQKFPSDEPCLRLKAEIFKKLNPLKTKRILESYFSILEQWFQVTRWHSVDMLFEFAVTAFKLQYYTTAFKVFPKLDRFSQGHPDRFSIREYLQTKDDRKTIYNGTIVRIKNAYEGEIRVDSMPRLERNILFSIEECSYPPEEGDSVSFYIGFNLVSPKAVDVHPRE